MQTLTGERKHCALGINQQCCNLASLQSLWITSYQTNVDITRRKGHTKHRHSDKIPRCAIAMLMTRHEMAPGEGLQLCHSSDCKSQSLAYLLTPVQINCAGLCSTGAVVRFLFKKNLRLNNAISKAVHRDRHRYRQTLDSVPASHGVSLPRRSLPTFSAR